MLIDPPIVATYNAEELISVKDLSEKYNRLTDFIYKRLIKFNIKPKAMYRHKETNHLVRLYLYSECKHIFENSIQPIIQSPSDNHIEISEAAKIFEAAFGVPINSGTYKVLLPFFINIFKIEFVMIGDKQFILRDEVDWIIKHFTHMASQQYESV